MTGRSGLNKKRKRHTEVNEMRTRDAAYGVYQKGAPKGNRVNKGFHPGW